MSDGERLARPRGRLAARFVVAAVLAATVAAAGGGWLTRSAAREAFRTEVVEQSRDFAGGLADRIDSGVVLELDTLRLVTTRRPVADLAPDVAAELRVVLRTKAELDRLVLYDVEGRPLAVAAQDARIDPSELEQRTDISTLMPHSGAARLVRNGVELTVPVERPPGTVVGALEGLVPLVEIGAPLATPQFARTVRGLLVDRSGSILFDPHGAAGEGWVAPPAEQESGFRERNGRTEVVVAAETAQLPMSVVLVQFESGALAQLTRATRELIVIQLLVIAAIALAVAGAGAVLLRPLRELAAAAARIRTGDHSARVVVRDRTELGFVGREFNRMAEALEARIRELRERKEAEERLRQQARVAQTLHEVGRALTGSVDLDDIAQAVIDTATPLAGADFGAFFYNVLNEQGLASMRHVLSGVDASLQADVPLPRNIDVFTHAFAGRSAERMDDVTVETGSSRTPGYAKLLHGHLGFRSYLAVPVVSREGEVLGGMYFGHPEAAVFGETEERLAVGIATQAAVAIENARLYLAERSSRARAERRRRRLEVLAEASRKLSSSLDLEATIRNVTELCSPNLADVSVVDLLQEDGSFRRLVSHSESALATFAEALERHPIDATDPDHPILRVMREGSPLVVDPIPRALLVGTSQSEEGPVWGPMAEATATVVPLSGRSDVIGTLTFINAPGSPRTLSPGDVALVEELGRRAALAIEHARLYATQRSVAETLQRSLLPAELPAIPGVELAARYVPGGPGVDIGGDWYDVVELPGGTIAVAMGDVVGRGIRAAVLMGQLRNALRAYALEGHPPAEVVSRLDRLIQDLGTDLLATLVYGVFEPESGTVRFTNAGHPPPLVVAPDGSASYLEGGRGVPLGALPGSSYGETATVLGEGSTLVLYTDGLVEDRTTPLDVGLARLRDAVASAPPDVEGFCDHLIEQGLGSNGASDDTAVMAFRAVALGTSMRMWLPAKPTVLAPLRATFRRWLLAVGATDDEIYEVLVSVGEACSNVIEHAGPTVKGFEIEAVYDGVVTVSVRDDGRWRPERPSNRGRGLSIMRAFMDDIHIEQTDGGTEVRMRKEIGRRDRRGAAS